AAAAEALQDVLDVVRQRGNGLADRSQSFRLHQGLVITGLLDGEGSLVADGDGQRQVVLVEFRVDFGSMDDLMDAAARVQVDDAEQFVPALHRHADRLADAEADDALAALEAGVPSGIRDKNSLLFAQDVIHDGPADNDLLVTLRRIAPADGFRLEAA